MSAVRVVVEGRVQGVGFRVWTQHQAELHGLDGWVRNRRDGSVEAVFAGPEPAVTAMLKACEQGPRGSQVERIEILVLSEGVPSGFQVLPTE